MQEENVELATVAGNSPTITPESPVTIHIKTMLSIDLYFAAYRINHRRTVCRACSDLIRLRCES